MKKVQYRTMDSTFYGLLLAISGKRRKDHVRYMSLLDKFELPSVEGSIRMNRLLYATKVSEMKKTEMPKVVLFGEIEGKRGTGRQCTTWIDNLRDDLDAFGIDRKRWKKLSKKEIVEGLIHFETKWREIKIQAKYDKYLIELPFFTYLYEGEVNVDYLRKDPNKRY